VKDKTMFRVVLNAIFSILCILVVFSPAALRYQDPIPPDTVITLQRGACERRCAVYKVIIFADGTVIFDGQHYVRKAGLVKSRIEPEKIRKLIEDFKAVNYFNLREQYGIKGDVDCNPGPSDAPIATTSIATGGRSKTITHHHRCAGAVSEQLTALEDEIDKIANTGRLIK
jgi:hypothetical protein